jgi:hypothetical protein
VQRGGAGKAGGKWAGGKAGGKRPPYPTFPHLDPCRLPATPQPASPQPPPHVQVCGQGRGSHGRGDARRAGRQPLPLHRVPADRGRVRGAPPCPAACRCRPMMACTPPHARAQPAHIPIARSTHAFDRGPGHRGPGYQHVLQRARPNSMHHAPCPHLQHQPPTHAHLRRALSRAWTLKTWASAPSAPEGAEPSCPPPPRPRPPPPRLLPLSPLPPPRQWSGCQWGQANSWRCHDRCRSSWRWVEGGGLGGWVSKGSVKVEVASKMWRAAVAEMSTSTPNAGLVLTWC